MEKSWRERARLTIHTWPRTRSTSQNETSLRRSQDSMLISSDAFTFARGDRKPTEWLSKRDVSGGGGFKDIRQRLLYLRGFIYLFRHDILRSTIFCSVCLKETYGIKRHISWLVEFSHNSSDYSPVNFVPVSCMHTTISNHVSWVFENYFFKHEHGWFIFWLY